MQSSRLRARYRYIMGFFARATASFIFWEILLPRLGLRSLARRTRSQRYKQIAAQFRAMEYPTYVQLGQFTVPTALRANVSGLLTAPAITFWNIEKK